MSNSRDVQVRMCELAVGSAEDSKILRATLGSCVGIGLMWRQRSMYGLAHCLLPGPPADIRKGMDDPARLLPSAKYVIEALPALLTLMNAEHAPEGEIEAVLAGGANMMHYRTQIHEPIGEQNARVAQQQLALAKLRVVHVDVGGECGRQLTIDCQQHQYMIRRFTRPI
jgi:chemotaxis protein CheD